MASYKKQVVWYNPFNDQFMPIGNYGMQYTKIVLDVPLVNLTREIWEFSETYLGVQLNPSSTEDVTMYPSVPYESGTLEAFANGQSIDVQEFAGQKSFDLKLSQIQGKYLYIAYVPKDPGRFLGNNTQNLKEVYGLEASVYYSTRLRNTIELARTYVNRMLILVGGRPYLWRGGPANTELGSVQPKITETNAELHLLTLKDAITELSNRIIALGGSNISNFTKQPEYSVDFIEEVQKILTQCDAAAEILSDGDII